MKFILGFILFGLSLSAFAGAGLDNDIIIFGKRLSLQEKQLRFGSQFILKTSSNTGEILLSQNSGVDFSPLLTASTGVAGGSGIIVLTASPSLNNAIVVWDGTGGDQLGQASVTLDIDDIAGVASLTLSASITFGTASTYAYSDNNGNLRCSGDAGVKTEFMCGVDTASASPPKPPAPVCTVRMEGGSGVVGFIKRFTSIVINDCSVGSVSATTDAVQGSVYEIMDDGIYFVHCSVALGGDTAVGITLNAHPLGLNGTQYQTLIESAKLGSSHPFGAIGMTGVSIAKSLVVGDEITCHITIDSDVNTATDHYFQIDRIH